MPLNLTLTWFALLKHDIYGRIITVNTKIWHKLPFYFGSSFFVKKYIIFFQLDILKFDFNIPSLLMGGYGCCISSDDEYLIFGTRVLKKLKINKILFFQAL